VYKIKNILIYLYLVSEENPNSNMYDIENCIKMDKAKVFAAHLATSWGAPFKNQRATGSSLLHSVQMALRPTQSPVK
jgi:hypothetical protein